MIAKMYARHRDRRRKIGSEAERQRVMFARHACGLISAMEGLLEHVQDWAGSGYPEEAHFRVCLKKIERALWSAEERYDKLLDKYDNETTEDGEVIA